MTALSRIQRQVLRAMYIGNGIFYAYEFDTTMLALKRRELVVFQRAAKYGRDHWYLTETGTGIAASLVASAKRKLETQS